MVRDFFNYIVQYADFIVLTASVLFLISYFIRWILRDGHNSDDEEGGGGGGFSKDDDDPVLDLPPGVSLPTDKPEPELTH